MGDDELIAGRYRLLEVLGEGGQATVHRALDLRTGSHVAVKVLDGEVARDETAVARVVREQQAMVALAGTNAVKFIDLCDRHNGTLCLVMELLEGQDLEARLVELDRVRALMPISEIVEVMQPLVDTLDKAHAVGIVHRDLKPNNIFLLSRSSGGGSRLLDFGLANLSTSEPLTKAGLVMGSPSYIAPESWAGVPGRSGVQADVYSLGVILFRMMSGRMPFTGRSLLEKMRSATGAERPSLHELRAELPPQVDIWVERTLAVDPKDRFSSAGACFGELLWALNLAPHPSEQKRNQVSKEHALEIQAWLATDAPRASAESLPMLSIEPTPISSESPRDGGEARTGTTAKATSSSTDNLPLLSVEPIPISDPAELGGPRATHPANPAAKKKTLRGLPPIPRAPGLPGKEISAAFMQSEVPSTQAPHAVPERSGLRKNLENEEWDDPTTHYAHAALRLDASKKK